MTKVKNILFKIDLEGKGVVNYDSSDQRFMFKHKKGDQHNKLYSQFKNTNYAKKRFFYDENADGKMGYKLVISSNCLRHEIFIKNVELQCADIAGDDMLLYSYIASPASMLRGYLFSERSEILKRSGAISITDAEQTCGSISHLETFVKSGKKKKKDENNDNNVEQESDNTYFKKEVVGDIKYSAHGFIDLMALQFVSCDQIYDRFAFNSDQFNIFKDFLSFKLENFNSELGYYEQVNADSKIGEHGFLFSNENILKMVKMFFEYILEINIRRANSYAVIKKLQIKLVYDPLVDTMSNKDGWITINSREDIESINFESENFYILKDEQKELELRKKINDNIEERRKEKAAIKKIKSDIEKAAKASREKIKKEEQKS